LTEQVTRLKTGVKALIRHSAVEALKSLEQTQCSPGELREALQTTVTREWHDGLHGGRDPFVCEIFSDTDPIAKEAVHRGHNMVPSKTLRTGYNFLKKSDRERAEYELSIDKPYLVVLAFPCAPWSSLQNLNPGPWVARRRRLAKTLVEWSVKVAKAQLAAGRLFVIENPSSSMAWQVVRALRQFMKSDSVYICKFDQCRFGLKSATGGVHRKRTIVVTNSREIYEELDGKMCQGGHDHTWVIGGKKISVPAGHYTRKMAKAVLRGAERTFEIQFGDPFMPHKHMSNMSHEVTHEAMAGEMEDDETDLPERMDDDTDSDDENVEGFPDHENSKTDPIPPEDIDPQLMKAVRNMHINTGHRPIKQLVRALHIAGAPREAIIAAKHLKCDRCQETRNTKTRRPATIPKARNFGDVGHMDLIQFKDAAEEVFWALNIVDAASGHQVVILLANKTSAAVIEAYEMAWASWAGHFVTSVVDMGPEFVSNEFCDHLEANDSRVHHIPVEAPWQNGNAERGGAAFKTILAAVVAEHSPVGFSELQAASNVVTQSRNEEINETGFSASQWILGKQRRIPGDVLNASVTGKLGTHGALELPKFAARLAMLETAKRAIVRLRFSRRLARAEMARARQVPESVGFTIGDMVYFFRKTAVLPKAEDPRKRGKRRIVFNRWHGPAVVLAKEGTSGIYLGYRGNVTKCAPEAVRMASTLEQLAAESWAEALDDVLSACDKVPSAPEAAEKAQEQPVSSEARHASEMLAALERPSVAPAPVGPAPEASEPAQEVGILPAQQQNNEYWQQPATLEPAAAASPQEVAPEAEAGGETHRSPPETVSPAEVPVPDEGVPEATPPVVPKLRSPFVGQEVRPPLFHGLRGPNWMDELPVRATRLREYLDRKRSASVPPRLAAPPPAESHKREASPGPLASPGKKLKENPTMYTIHNTCNEVQQIPKSDHPLLEMFRELSQEEKGYNTPDHGTWKGSWALPSRSTFERMCDFRVPGSGMSTLRHSEDRENGICLAQRANKEKVWSKMSRTEQQAFTDALQVHWGRWLENEAVEVMPLEESIKLRKLMEAEGTADEILNMRTVLTDKNEGNRTPSNPLPLEASSRITVPGYKDKALLKGELRTDAPTASRNAQMLVLLFTSSHLEWYFSCADVRAAFLKGKKYVNRKLYASPPTGNNGPRILGIDMRQLIKILKGVFGLADAPREWYLALDEALLEAGWVRMHGDLALWVLRGDNGEVEGLIAGHVDDLMFGGNERAHTIYRRVGDRLGLGKIEYDDFTWCGKRFQRLKDGSIRMTMTAYHENMSTVYITKDRLLDIASRLTERELRSFRAVLGSLQWLIAQLRWDFGMRVSSLAGETSKACIGSLMRANEIVTEMKQDPDFALTFRPMNLSKGGIIVVTDAALGNVDEDGFHLGEADSKVFSQSCYMVGYADADLLSGKTGTFNPLDSRSHRVPRVSRSSYGSETMGFEEGVDAAQLLRMMLAEVLGHPVLGKQALESMDKIPLTAVVDAKDTHDKVRSDTSSWGSMKSLAYTVAWLRQQFRRKNVAARWTATENMFLDAGTKDMDTTHFRNTLARGIWSIEYSVEFIKPKKNSRLVKTNVEIDDLLGEEPKEEILPLLKSCQTKNGWLTVGKEAIQIARNAKSYRTPQPRYSSSDYPLRSSYVLFHVEGKPEWRCLEERHDYMKSQNPHAPFGRKVDLLVSIFEPGAAQSSVMTK